MKPWIIYGAYGYTGELITQLAAEKGLSPILAGRDEQKLKPLAAKYGLQYRAFDLNEPQKIVNNIKDATLVLNCAGPFAHTAKAMIGACLSSGIHYLDITGELSIFESAARKDEAAKKAGIMLMPGTGFDVVPSDCLAAFVKSKMPDAVKLVLAFKGTGGLSRGTATTMTENISEGGAARKDGKIVKVPAAWKSRMINFGKGQQLCVTIPWGDVSTAYYSTGIPDIEVYTAVSPAQQNAMKASRYLGWLLGSAPVQRFLKKKIQAKQPGPDDGQRKKGKSLLFAEAENGKGNKVTAQLSGPEGYTLTALTSVNIALKVLNGNFKPGYMTPSMAYGADLIMEIEGVERT